MLPQSEHVRPQGREVGTGRVIGVVIRVLTAGFKPVACQGCEDQFPQLTNYFEQRSTISLTAPLSAIWRDPVMW
jgi:hypothetical protein